MKKYLDITFFIPVILIIVSCETSPNLPSLVSNNPTTEVRQETIISLEDLNADTPDSIWEQFFIQRGNEAVWKSLQAREDSLYFYSEKTEQDNQVTIAILRYLNLHQLSIKFMLCISAGFEQNGENMYIIPEEANNFTRLQDFKLSNSSLLTIPLELLSFTNLQELDVSKNQIHEVSSKISNFTNLYELDLSHNSLTKLPDQVSNLTSLRSLDLHANQISELPNEIAKLNVAHLTLSSNKLEELPMPVTNLTSLRHINLSSNQLKKLPAEISNLPKLEYLNISNNLLEYIPSQIGNCTTLCNLNLSNNRLKEIPSEVGKLIKLRILVLSENQLNTLPAEIYNLTNLVHLRIDYNYFAKLRASLFPLIHSISILEESALLLDNNPWIDANSSILTKLGQAEVETSIYQHFPLSLTTLCTQYIEGHPELFSTQELDDNLPYELQKTARENYLKHSYLWKKSQNVVFFKSIITKHIPFYLDFPVASTKETVKHMLEQLGQEQFYKIL
jgi:Leucine-rich repeat (LRR) protein